MAVTNIKRQEELAQKQSPVQSTKPYDGLPGVSQNTSNNLGNYQAGYKPSQTVTNAQNALQQAQAQKPASYANQYSGQLQSILNQIMNPQQFKYNFADDELFKYYADLYTENGKQAALDVQGQAAGLTGGYGNSYGATVGNQQYQQYLRELYDRGMDLRDRAYQEYSDQNADRYNQMNALQAADQADWQKYQADLAAWQNDRDFAAQQEALQYDRDYTQYGDQRDYWTGMAQIENAQYNTDQDRQEAIRQYNQNFAEEQRQYDQNLAESQRQYDQNFAEEQRQYNINFGEQQRQFNLGNELDWAKLQEQQRQYDAGLTEEQRQYDQSYAIDLASAILANGQMPSNELLVASGLSYEDAQKLMAQIASGGSSSQNSKNETGTGKEVQLADSGKMIESFKDWATSGDRSAKNLVNTFKQNNPEGMPVVTMDAGSSNKIETGVQYKYKTENGERKLYKKVNGEWVPA